MSIRNWDVFRDREKVRIFDKEEKQETSSLVKNKLKKLYSFCICDICAGEVIIKTKDKNYKSQINGGIASFNTPQGDKFQVGLHNSCLKIAVKDYQEFLEEKIKTREEKYGI